MILTSASRSLYESTKSVVLRRKKIARVISPNSSWHKITSCGGVIPWSTRTSGSAADKNMKYGLYVGVFIPTTCCSTQMPARKSTFGRGFRLVSKLSHSLGVCLKNHSRRRRLEGSTGNEKLADVRMLMHAFFSCSLESLSESSATWKTCIWFYTQIYLWRKQIAERVPSCCIRSWSTNRHFPPPW